MPGWVWFLIAGVVGLVVWDTRQPPPPPPECEEDRVGRYVPMSEGFSVLDTCSGNMTFLLPPGDGVPSRVVTVDQWGQTLTNELRASPLDGLLNGK